MEKKKILSVVLASFMAISITGCELNTSKAEQEKFNEFINNDFIEMMESDWTYAHIYLENPEKFGVDESTIEVSWGEVPNDTIYDEIRQRDQELVNEWEQFHRDKLTDKQKVIYDTYDFYLELNTNLSKEKFDYVYNYFSTLSGVHTQFATFFSDITLIDETDVTDMLLLLEDTKPFVEELIQYTNTQAEKGYLMINLDSVIEYCTEIVNQGSNSSILSCLKDNIEEANISDEKKEQYKKDAEELFLSSFIPAYENIISSMESLKESDKNEDGLWALENGEQYYEYLFQNATGSNRSVDGTRNLLYEVADDAWNEISEILQRRPELEEKFYDDEITTSYVDYESMLSDLSTKIKEDFPEIGEINYQIEPIAEEIVNDGVAAYFNIPAIDGTTAKKIRVNESSEKQSINSISTFKTIAHEGFPGHMYQIAYLYENIESPWLKVNTNIGFDEGMATYIEYYSLKYLDNIDSDYLSLYENMEVYSNCIFALLDISVHYDELSKNEVIDMIVEMGYDEESAFLIYEQLQENPTAFLSYYVGYAEIIDLKNKAENKLGDNFNDKEFHEALQKNGSVPFSIIQDSVKSYIEESQ